jgi:hypothetical protein
VIKRLIIFVVSVLFSAQILQAGNNDSCIVKPYYDIDSLRLAIEPGSLPEHQKFAEVQLVPVVRMEAERGNYTTVSKKLQNTESVKIWDTKSVDGSTGWLFIFFIFDLLIILWLRLFYWKIVEQLFVAIVNIQSGTKLIQEKGGRFILASFMLIVLFCLNMGLLAYEGLETFYEGESLPGGVLLLAICCGLIVFFYGIKNSMYYTTSLLFGAQQEMQIVLGHFNVYYKALGVSLVPFVIIIPYVPQNYRKWLLIAAFSLTGTFAVARVIRGIALSLKARFPFYYSFMYLCGLEILPIFYFLKIAEILN